MKKIVLAMIFVLVITGMAAAQPRGSWGGGIPQPVQTTTIEGTLQLHNGQIAVSTGETIVYVPGLRRYVGFVEGIKEGSRVSVTGFHYGNVVRPAQFTVDGKTYELASNTPPAGFGSGYGYNRGGYGCCQGFGGPGSRHGYGQQGRRGR